MTKANNRVFRSDIAGLRAWAVMAVVLFHFGVPGFSGGFVGVDIFFVISGYLMTQIIVNGIQSGDERKFSIFDFYVARARRIVPALLVLCSSLLIVGWFFLPAADYRQLSVHVITSVLFISNIQYWKEAGYFDSASHDKWLLHTWSLSVEWQFYLLLPLILGGVWRLWPGRRVIAKTLVIGFAASLALSVWITYLRPEAAFFLLPTRAWEMLAGGLVALYGEQWSSTRLLSRRMLERLGFALIALAIATANPAYWPGAAAVLPVMGTVLILFANRQDSWLTAPSIMQHLGNWSYSIYLWHWPLAVVLVYLGWQNQVGAVIIAILLSLLLGWSSYHWVEAIGRRLMKNSRRSRAIIGFSIATILVALPAFSVRSMQGLPGRLSPEVEKIAASAYDTNPFRELSHTMGGAQFKSHIYGGSNIRAIVLGDSHASSIVTAVQAALNEPEDGVLSMSYTSCPTLFGVQQERKDLHCSAFNEWAMSEISKLPAKVPVIIANRSSAYLYGNKYGSHQFSPEIYFEEMSSKMDEASFMSEYSSYFVRSVCRIAKATSISSSSPS